MSSSTEEIKERLPVVQVVSSYVKLDRAGQNYKARCPFHNEKTPSFIVSPSRNTYHCFGCNRGGDIFTFVEEIEGVDFKRALEILAERAGVMLERRDPKERSVEERLYQIIEEATAFYEKGLRGNAAALEYLKGRGLSDETIASWRLGYALNDWRTLLTYLRGRKWSDAEIEKTGLVIKGEKGYYDRFRGRITFPVGNAQGKVVGFSGRHFLPAQAGVPGVKEEAKSAAGAADRPTPHQDDEAFRGAKYINTPETALYNKSKVLYGFDKAKQSIMRENMAVLVEGQMDLVMSHQAGVTNAVASSGTALTEEHLKMIKRFTDKLVMAFDGDEAGFNASERGYGLALSLGMDVRIAKLPPGVDPADLAKQDPEAWKRSVAEARHIVDFYIDSLLERNLEPRELKAEVSKRVLPYVARIRNRIDQAHFVGRIASVLLVDEGPVWEEVQKAERNVFETERGSEGRSPGKGKEERLREKLLGIIWWQEGKGKDERRIDVDETRKRYDALGGKKPMPDEGKNDLILQAEVYYEGSERLTEEVEELLVSLEQMLLEAELAAAMNALKLAERGKNEKEIDEALGRCHEISKKLNEVKQKFKYNP